MGHATVVVVEDDDLTRERLVAAVEADVGLSLLGDAATLREGRSLLRRDPPDVLLVDLGLPDGSGVELIRESPGDKLALVITVFGDEGSVVAALEAGARGYLLKDGTDEALQTSIHELLAGGARSARRSPATC